MSLRILLGVVAGCLLIASPAGAADSASGAVSAQKLGAIKVTHAAPYLVRDQRHARKTEVEILLTDVAIDPAGLLDVRNALSPHMAAINLPALKDRNYVLLWVDADGGVTMNATYSRTMTQLLNGSADDLKVTWTTRSPSRLEGRLFSGGPLKTMDGSTYTVDVRFGVDVPAPAAGQILGTGGGDAGKALTAFVASANKKNWPAIRAALSPERLPTLERSYNTPAENAQDVLDLLKAWLPTEKMKVTGGHLRGAVAVLDVEGELFPGQMGLSLVRMVKTGTVWQFDSAVRAGMVP
jgi:hypothetical protein